MRVEAQVVVVLERELVAEEEAAVEAAHVMIGEAIALHDILGRLVGGEIREARGVNPLGCGPVLLVNEAEVDGRLGAIAQVPLPLGHDGHLAQQDHIRIVVLVVESGLELDDGLLQ